MTDPLDEEILLRQPVTLSDGRRVVTIEPGTSTLRHIIDRLHEARDHLGVLPQAGAIIDEPPKLPRLSELFDVRELERATRGLTGQPPAIEPRTQLNRAQRRRAAREKR